MKTLFSILKGLAADSFVLAKIQLCLALEAGGGGELLTMPCVTLNLRIDLT